MVKFLRNYVLPCLNEEVREEREDLEKKGASKTTTAEFQM